MAIAVSALLLGLFAHEIPNKVQAVGILARVTESLRPHLLLLVLPLSAVLVLARVRVIGAILAIASVAGLLWIAAEYRRNASATGADSDLTVLWFNVFSKNMTSPEALERAIRDSGADLAIFTETESLQHVLDRLRDIYPHYAGPAPFTVFEPSLMILSKRPIDLLEPMGDLPVGPGRTAHFRVGHPGEQVEVVAVHLGKPWYLGQSGAEEHVLNRLVKRSWDGPLLVVGDFNAAPWSKRIREVQRRRGLAHAPLPVATWPTEFGKYGIPIDNVFLRGPVGLVSLAPWGAGLGSNHTGLIAEIDLGAEG